VRNQTYQWPKTSCGSFNFVLKTKLVSGGNYSYKLNLQLITLSVICQNNRRALDFPDAAKKKRKEKKKRKIPPFETGFLSTYFFMIILQHHIKMLYENTKLIGGQEDKSYVL